MNALARAFSIADRVSDLRRRRADAYGIRAGLGVWRNVWSNAMLAFAEGRPWREVDYGALRMAIRIDRMPSPMESVDRLYRRIIAGGAP